MLDSFQNIKTNQEPLEGSSEEINEKFFTVSEITRGIRASLEYKFSNIGVLGEISNVRKPSSGHVYLTLKDRNSQLQAVVFRNTASRIKFELKDGMEVISFGSITVYEPRGQYQLIINKMEPKGIGALQLAFQQLKEKLEKEGLFDHAHKKTIPFRPQKIAIVTSPTGAAIKDILNIIDRRFANVEILIYPVKVQGEGAAQEIAGAITELNNYSDIDVIITGRGGGSLEDLWAFNEEIVARSIYNSMIP
ncbi:MAG: exodeoxyribonuclease VII large subunit, partial [Gammaproteobacteria bacterium]|nr:exodeoxyribonuclease VII large subunit [Gammaproteobacteria bacterium]